MTTETLNLTELEGRDRLAIWIRRSHIDQREAAQLIGMDPTQLSKVMLGHRTPGLVNAIKIERATGIPVEAWVAGSTDDSTLPDAEWLRKRKIAK